MKKDKVRRHSRIQYPAAGIQSDIEVLLQRFVDTKSVRYEEFSRLWCEGNYSLIHAGRNGLRENREFMEESFKIVLKFALPPYSLQVRVGAMYALYALYHTQRMKYKIKVRIPLCSWSDVMELHEEVISNRHLDVDYIIRKMIHDDVFEYVAHPTSLTIEEFYKDEDDDDDEDVGGYAEETDNSWSKDVDSLSKLLDEDSLGQLYAVHEKYHQLKCQLHATAGGDPNTPSSSLDLIQSDVVDTIVDLAQQPEISVTSPKKNTGRSRGKPKESEESASERASRIREIKKRALEARANTDSSALRYLNTGPELSQQTEVTSARKPRGGATKKKRGRSTKTSKKKNSSLLLSDSDDSAALSDEDVIKGVISTIRPQLGEKLTSTKKVPSRKAKQKAHLQLSNPVFSDTSDSSDKDDGVVEDEDYDIAKECADLTTGSRSLQRALKRAKQSGASRDKDGDDLEVEKASDAKSSSQPKKHRFMSFTSPIPTISSDPPPSSTAPEDGGLSNKEDRDSESAAPRHVERSITEISDPSSSSTEDEDEDESSAKRPRLLNCPEVVLPTEEESRLFKLKQNNMVAFKPVGTWKDRPLVGKVITFTDRFVNVIWYKGGYKKEWNPLTIGKGEDKKIQRDKISRDHVLMKGFHLSTSGKIPVKVMKKLRKLYSEFDR